MIVNPRFFWSGILLGVIGCLFYANFREPEILFDAIPAFSLFTLTQEPILLPDYISEWVPSFLHVIGMSLFTLGIVRVKQGAFWKVPLFWALVDITFEALQYYENGNLLTWGNFEWVDIVAIIVSALVTAVIIKRCYRVSTIEETSKTNLPLKPVGSTVAVGVGAFMMLGSYMPMPNECEFPDGSHYRESDPYDYSLDAQVDACEVEPIYLSFDKIRESGFVISKTMGEQYVQPLKNTRKIYTYHNLLLINELMLGVHVYDNSDPSEPKYLDFISLIGNQDMAIKDNYLYLDSFKDLVIFDLTNIELKPTRVTNVFTIQSSNNLIPDGTYYETYPNAYEGIVIGYINKAGKKFYFWTEYQGLEG